MSERLNSEDFSKYISGQATEELPQLAEQYHNRRNSGIKKLAVGVAFTGGAVATTLLTNGEALRYVALGELAVGSFSSLSGLDNLFTGRNGEKAAKQELQSRNNM